MLVSHAEGRDTIASADYSHAGGNNTVSSVMGTVSLGLYGETIGGTTGLTGVSGNGGEYSIQLMGGVAPPTIPGDGVSIILRTDVFGTQPYSEVIANVFTTANADYGEWLEWKDDNKQKRGQSRLFC